MGQKTDITLVGKTERKGRLGGPRRQMKNNKMNLNEYGKLAK
jgi:hypothetical protein